MGTLYGNPDFAETAPLPKVTTDLLAEWEQTWREQNPDTWMQPLRQGGGLAEQHVTHAMRRRGWLSEAVLAVLTASRRTRRSRRAPSRGKHA